MSFIFLLSSLYKKGIPLLMKRYTRSMHVIFLG